MSGKFPERTPWYASIVTRITLVFAVLLLAAIAITGWFSWQASRSELIAQAGKSREHTLDVVTTRLLSVDRTLRENLDLLATNEAMLAWCTQADTADTVARSAAIQRVIGFIDPFIRSRGRYAQVRLIAADSAGMEVVRFDRTSAGVLQVPDSLLQAKGDRDYYRATMALGPEERIFFPIDLNKERGSVQRPFMPTLRATAPLFSPRGARAGMVIINADMRPLFAELLAMADSGITLMLAGRDNELLLHPDTSLMFRFDLGGTSKMDAALPLLIHQGTGDSLLVTARELTFGPANDGYTVVIAQPMSMVLRELRAKRDELTKLLAIIAGSAITLALLFALGVRARLNKVTRRMERYAVGSPEELPTGRRDEIGRMARGLRIMQERIDARVKELEMARAAAETSDQQRRDLLANMSHEVRTPLNAIIGLSSDLDNSRMHESEREKLAVVQRSAMRLKGLVDDLLMHARIGEGKLAVNITAVDVRTLIEDILRAHRPGAIAKGLTLTAQLDELHVRVGTDALRLHQIVDNLVGNAVRFTPRGSVTVAASSPADDRLLIEVTDTGPGIPESERQRVFERFERATTSEQEQGTGLGLAITRRVVDLLGGRLELHSEVGNGARFVVELPVQAAPSDVGAPVGPEASGRIDEGATTGLRVLYVEDVATNRMLVQDWAVRWRWKLTMVENGETAVDVCERETFDLLLIDLGLGHGMSGSELALRLRGTKRHRYTPMIAVTAYAQDGDDAEALKVGMNDRVTKPIERSMLLHTCLFWTQRLDPPGEAPDLSGLNAQYDDDREKLLKVYQQYRKEFTQHRLALRDALLRGDHEALVAVRHKLRPHWQLLGLNSATQALDDLDASVPAGPNPTIEQAFRGCDRALMHAQRTLFTASSVG